MLKTFTYNGISSADFGILIGSDPKLSRPARKFSVANIAGRNGNLYDIQDAWEEVIQEYQILAGLHMTDTASDLFYRIFDWLNSANGYVELKDDYDLTHYRLAVCIDATEVVTGLERFGKATIRFRCRPERFLNSGKKLPLNITQIGTKSSSASTIGVPIYSEASTSSEVIGSATGMFEITETSESWYKILTEDDISGWVQSSNVTVQSGVIITNPTNHIAKPYITIGNPNLTWNDITISYSGSLLPITGVEIDCENEYFLNINNRYVTVTQNGETAVEFPSLKPKVKTYIIYDTTKSLEINARYWEI